MTRLTSKTERLAARQIPEGALCVTLTAAAAVYTYERLGRFFVIAYRGTAARPAFHYCYTNTENRQAKIDEFLQHIDAIAARKAEAAAARKAWQNPLAVDSILYTSWGYDQTNVDFFVVTAIKGKRVTVAPIAAESIASGFMSGTKQPAAPIKIVGTSSEHIAQPSGARGVYVKISKSCHAWPYDGQPKHFSTYA